MEDSTSLRDLEQTEGENALLPGDLRVQPYMYEPRRPTITIASHPRTPARQNSTMKRLLIGWETRTGEGSIFFFSLF